MCVFISVCVCVGGLCNSEKKPLKWKFRADDYHRRLFVRLGAVNSDLGQCSFGPYQIMFDFITCLKLTHIMKSFFFFFSVHWRVDVKSQRRIKLVFNRYDMII